MYSPVMWQDVHEIEQRASIYSDSTVRRENNVGFYSLPHKGSRSDHQLSMITAHMFSFMASDSLFIIFRESALLFRTNCRLQL